jgi:hypothetical protein
MAGQFDTIIKNSQETLDWSASVYDYLMDAFNKLALLRGKVADPSAGSIFRNVKRNLKYAFRSVGKMTSFYRQTKEAVDAIKKLNPPVDIKNKLESLLGQITPNEAMLIETGSYFRGSLNDDVERVGAMIGLLKKKKTNAAEVQADIDKLRVEIAKIIAKPGLGIGTVAIMGKIGLVPFQAAVRSLRDYVSKLGQKLAA